MGAKETIREKSAFYLQDPFALTWTILDSFEYFFLDKKLVFLIVY